jgi:hypothetical protein
MVAALHWCSKNDVDLINMSMGTKQYSDFAAVVEAVTSLSHIPIVAACSNSNTLTFPACLPTVIGVRYCEHKLTQDSYIYQTDPYDQVEVLVCSVDNTIQSNSMATPIVTARVCEYILNGDTEPDVIKQRLKLDSIKNYSFADYSYYKLIP